MWLAEDPSSSSWSTRYTIDGREITYILHNSGHVVERHAYMNAEQLAIRARLMGRPASGFLHADTMNRAVMQAWEAAAQQDASGINPLPQRAARVFACESFRGAYAENGEKYCDEDFEQVMLVMERRSRNQTQVQWNLTTAYPVSKDKGKGKARHDELRKRGLEPGVFIDEEPLYVYICNMENGQTLDNFGAVRSKIGVWDRHIQNRRQIWELIPHPKGGFCILSADNGQALDNLGANNSEIGVWDPQCIDKKQSWKIKPKSWGFVIISAYNDQALDSFKRSQKCIGITKRDDNKISQRWAICQANAVAFNMLLAGSKLRCDEVLKAGYRDFRARMQSDGNFVIYKSSNFTIGNAIWSSATFNQGKHPYELFMQPDGDLVLYDNDGTALWATNTAGQGSPNYYLIMQNDGNLVLYDGEKTPLWASHTDESYIFFPGMDSNGGDIRQIHGKNVDELKNAGMGQVGCVAFNTNGWLKSYVLPMSQWTHWTNEAGKGMYVKNIVTDISY